MSDIRSRINDDEDRYLALCAKFGEEPRYEWLASVGGKMLDVYGSHHKSLEERNQNSDNNY